MPAALPAVIVSEGNGHLCKNDGMVDIDGIFAPFCFSFFVTYMGDQSQQACQL